MTAATPTPRLRNWSPALLLLALAWSGAAWSVAPEPAPAVDAGWILAKLARPLPSRTGFVELRDSKLLQEPLRIAGEYRRPDADTLVREVRAPYAETTTIRAGEVSIARSGKATRRFSLSRAPELAGLQASFGALLAGDRKRLEQHYTLASEGSRERWTLVLTPKDAAMAEKVRAIALYGRGAELRCIETRPAADGGQAQRTLLAGAAREAGDVASATALAALCHAAQG
ncbi:fatty acyl CoA synthetase [Luteimonas sp. 50]|uniref:Fatty acyl CoA synthetase n=1 Tax=Cognatiluteimonas sedimenti TaxID=2927791 RepID=A0ABT0A619_9GAMM|nr:LolA-related protein [Lysobacter sedimenti]MCJ0826427.1 fatty acyl CoA synthetase [Lysobacter sedimenti]